MFNRRTLFIVGAGASEEAGLPVGTGLANAIRSRLDLGVNSIGNPTKGDGLLYSQFMKDAPGPVAGFQRAFNTIRDGILLSNSIDDFLNVHQKDAPIVEVGKASIVRAILEAERKSRLFVDRSNIYNKPNYLKLANSWFVKFMRVLGPGTSINTLEDVFQRLAFVVFNYDRCIEQFLSFGLQHLYAMNAGAAVKMVQNATIIHPYGSVGMLSDVPFGGNGENRYDYRALSARIKTYTEQLTERETIQSIKYQVRKAERIVFLGFAFHNQNMALLEPTAKETGKEVFGTALGMSNADVAIVRDVLSEFFPEERASPLTPRRYLNINLENQLTCAGLFDHYAKSIAR